MGARKTLLLSLCLVILAVFSGYMLLKGDGESEGSGLKPSAALAQEAESPAGILPDAGLAPASAAGAAERVDVILEEEQEEAAALAAERQWVTGKVAFSFPIPADEELHVMSLAGVHSERSLYGNEAIADAVWDADTERDRLHDSARVEADGSFRISLPETDTEVNLALSGRYIYSRSSQAFSLSDSEPEIILSGQLGAWIRGQVNVPAPSLTESWADGVEMELGPDVTGSFNAMEIGSQAYAVKTQPMDTGRFEFRGVSNTFTRGLFVKHPALASRLILGLKPDPGERVDIDVDLELGATLHGVVLDESAEPVVGAPVSVWIPGPAGQAIGALRETTTEEGGAFTLEHVLTGRKLQLTASPEDHLAGRLRLEDRLRDQQVVANLVIEVSRGETISGRVLYPDGEPAGDAKVNLGPDLSNVEPAMMGRMASRNQTREVQTLADGSFTIGGLSEGPFKLVARLESDEGDHAGNWRGRLVDVRGGTQTAEILMAGVTALRGRVETASTLPIESFVVHLTLKGSGGMMGIGAERRQETVEAPDAEGEFEAGNIPPGLWEVTVRAKGFAESAVQEIELPQGEALDPPVFPLSPAAQVSGMVLDSVGAPISGAKITLEMDLGQRMAAQRGGGVPKTISDHEGKFLLEGIEPGTPSLVATLTGYAGSEPKAVEVESGQLVEEVLLVLRAGGTIAGEVLGDDGPIAGRMVIVQNVPNYSTQHIMQSGSEGEFRVEHVEPGSWQVISMPNVMTGEVDAENSEGMGDLMNGMEIDVVDVVEGEETWVTLGKPPEDPIEVMGSVTQAGEAAAGSVVVFVPEDGEGLGDMKMCTTNSNGDFRLTLDKRGAYLVTVQGNVGTGRQNSIEYQELIPEEVKSHHMQLKLPGGGISGRVIGADGEPAANCRITLNVDGGIAYGSFLGGHYTEMVTDSEGRFDIEHLRAGSYTVAAGGAIMSGLFGDDSEGGRVLKDGLLVKDGEWLRGVDFRLKRPGELTGVVRDSNGSPVPGAAVFVRDGEGRLLERFSMVSTNGAGKFSYKGVAEGEYRVVAKKDDQVSPLSDPVHVKEGGTASRDVELADGCTMLVSVTDRTGADIRARITVRDSKGNEMTGMLSTAEIMEHFGRGFSSNFRPDQLHQHSQRIRTRHRYPLYLRVYVARWNFS